MKSGKQSFSSEKGFRDTLYAFQTSRVILTAYELDIFSNIITEGATSKDIAKALRTDLRATDRLMNALCAIGLLRKKDSIFYNSDFSGFYLSKRSPGYLKGFGHTVNMWNTWSNLTEVVRTGKSIARKPQANTSNNWAESFIGAMHERAKENARHVIGLIPLYGIQSMLDIGGGSGVYSMEFVKRDSKNKATVFDLPDIIPITKKYVDDAELTKQFSYIKGNYNEDALGTGYDMIFLSAIVHINSAEQNLALVKKCYDALNKNGLIVIQDHLMEDDRSAPFAGALFALNMLVGTEHGDTYTETEIRDWYKKAGFSKTERVDTFNNGMIIGRKK